MIDPLSGEESGKAPWIGGHHCQSSKLAGRHKISSYGVAEMQPRPGREGKLSTGLDGVRPSCIEGYVPAYGMVYSAQNNCRCKPGAVYGFFAVGPSGEHPAAGEFAATRPTEKGPAFGKAVGPAAGPGDWPTRRHDAERSAFTASPISGTPRVLWKSPVARSDGGPLAPAWSARLESSISSPVVAAGKAYVAATDEDRIVALDAATGGEAWSVLPGGRVDSPPTYHEGLCLVGCHDGWVYALRASDGELAWRTRLAPRERRMVAFGQVESVWPAPASVMVHGGVAYATAGRTSESDGGTAMAALDPRTGRPLWVTTVGKGLHRQNDILCHRDGTIGWHYARFDITDGRLVEPKEMHPLRETYGGGKNAFSRSMIDGTWTVLKGRRSGAFTVDNVKGDVMAWSEGIAVHPKGAVDREAVAPLWDARVPRGTSIEAMAMAGDTVLCAVRASGGSLLRGVSARDGGKLFDLQLEERPVFDGIAVAGGRVYVSLRSGELLCLEAD
jgi:outer membrane protein assembly factor BamB